MEDFQESRDKIIMGVKREDRLSEEEKEKVAYHEAGHALTALMLPGADPLKQGDDRSPGALTGCN